MRTIAIFGAGPALGMAVARRFGREGFRVALVARSRDRLDGMVAALAGEGLEAAAFPADLTDRASVLRAVDEIEARLGSVDVVQYSPAGGDHARMSPSEIDAATAATMLESSLLTPIALVNRLLPGMVERGDGGLLFALGGAAKYPIPRLAGGGMALAGLRNYAHTLHAELEPKGVYAGTLLIGALIEGSAAHHDAAAWSADGQSLPVVSPGDLADRFWNMYLKRNRLEDEVTPDTL
jgi:short-subunit dehydrogenase